MMVLRRLAPVSADRPSRPFRLTVEMLEDRCVPAGLHFNFVIDDPTNAFAAYPLLRNNLEAAGQILGSVLEGLGSLEVRVRPTSGVDRAGGSTVAMVYGGYQSGAHVYDHGTVSEARTGVDPNGAEPDLELLFNPSDYLSLCWFDPSGAARTATLPSNKIDFISVAIHETLHALGFQGYRTIEGPGYGTFPDVYRTRFDSLTQFGAGGNPAVLYFVGTTATGVYGGPVPLTSWGANHAIRDENFYHVGNQAGQPGSELIGDMMNGVEFRPGRRYQMSNLDLAMLNDLGWSLTPQAAVGVQAVVDQNRPAPSPTPEPAPAPTPPPLSGDVTPWVQVVLSRARYNSRTRRYERSVMFVNETDRTLAGPLKFAFEVIDRTTGRRRVVRVTGQIPIDGLPPRASLTVTITATSAAWGSPPVAVRVVAGG